ncbi:CBS domain-containing protein [Nitrosopumilus ureiphilus]|uniref:Histidine kinase n=1 Tax=Nitrosopumilus ureiphilus TaxID=1470067 RepID=A0A7D5RBU2_9ARCH|nr:CBS domain-containing protein [Nitrosopumilus ureiphilus]QLH07282.1 histidine kinase [Nitrosopumilus ureiphilus]
MSQLEELMNSPITTGIESTIADIAKIMLEKKISRVLVTENEKITSIVTEKDLGLFLLKDKSDRTLQQIPLSELSKPIITTSQSTEIQECAKIMLEKNIGSLGIVSDDKGIVGIITKTDLVKDFAKNHQNKKIVGEYMSAHYFWVYSDVNLSKVVSKMSENKISRVIVRNKEEIPIGIITFRDLFNLVISMGIQRDVAFPKSFESEQGLGKTLQAQEVMKNEIITSNYHEDMSKACQLLLDNKINGVGVLSDKGDLVGILSKTDIVKAIATLN